MSTWVSMVMTRSWMPRARSTRAASSVVASPEAGASPSPAQATAARARTGSAMWRVVRIIGGSPGVEVRAAKVWTTPPDRHRIRYCMSSFSPTAVDPDAPMPATTLDPTDPDGWMRIRETLHRAADRLLDHVRDQRDLPVWQEMPDADADAAAAVLGAEGVGTDRAWRTLEEHILPFGV